METYFTADTHFNHELMRKMRLFDSVAEMDETIIALWNDAVRPGDVVYHLGDFAFGKPPQISCYRSRLKGKVHLILGNHDYKNQINKMHRLFSSIADLKVIRHNKQRIVLCHYAMRVWSGSYHNSWQLYGHSHGNLESIGKQLDVGVDQHGLRPLHIDEVFEKLSVLRNNWDFRKRET